MNKILCFGSVGKDIFLPTSEGKIIETPQDMLSQKKIEFELGAKYKIDERFESLGGCAANVGVGLSRLGIRSGCVSNTGDDSIGEWALAELKKDNVDTENIKIGKDEKSDFSAILVDKKSADRVIFTNRNSNVKIELEGEKKLDAEWFFISDVHTDWKNRIEEIIELAKKEKKKIAYNPREAHIHTDPAEVIEMISLCDTVFLNKDEAIEIVSKMHEDISLETLNDEKFLIEKFAKLEIETVIITDGKRGAWVGSGGKIFFTKGLEVPAVDSTGAGDAFCSGFLASLLKGKEIQECLQWGIANSSSVVCHYGAISGLLTENEISEKIKNIEIKTL
jgi:sugar/nucleoside kinase (ribokinase family)